MPAGRGSRHSRPRRTRKHSKPEQHDQRVAAAVARYEREHGVRFKPAAVELIRRRSRRQHRPPQVFLEWAASLPDPFTHTKVVWDEEPLPEKFTPDEWPYPDDPPDPL